MELTRCMRGARLLLFGILGMGLSWSGAAQDLQLQVRVQAPNVQLTDRSVFEEMERALQEFANTTKWSTREVDFVERLQGSLVFNVTEYNQASGNMTGTLQVKFSRPVYKSDYQSNLLFFMDPDIQITYVENSILEFGPQRHSSNLTSVIAFYAYVALGLEAESFQAGGGKPYFDLASTVVANAQSANAGRGWTRFDGIKNRFWLIEDLQNPSNAPFLTAWTDYHRKGMDKLHNQDTQLAAKEAIKASIMAWKPLYVKQPNLFLLQWAIDAKADELLSVFSGGPSVPVTDLVAFLQQLDATNASKYLNLGKQR